MLPSMSKRRGLSSETGCWALLQVFPFGFLMGFYDYLLKLSPVPVTHENWQVTQGHGHRSCRTYFIFPDCNCTILSTVMNLKPISFHRLSLPGVWSHLSVFTGLQEGQGNSLDAQITCTVSRQCGCLGDAVAQCGCSTITCG